MKILSIKSVLLAAGLAGLGVAMASAQSTNAVADRPAAMPSVMMPTIRPVLPPLPTEIQTLINQFTAQRNDLIAARKVALDALKAATPEQRKAIITTLQTQAKDIMSDQRALGKQIREQLRELRKNQPKPGGG